MVDGIRLGQLTDLAKPDGTDREEGREGHCSLPVRPVHKAGCECVAHIVQTLTNQDVNGTVVTVEGVVTYDLISRNAILEGLLRMEGGDQILPFCTTVLRDPIHVSVGG